MTDTSESGIKKLLVAYDGSGCSEAILDDLKNAGLPKELDVEVLSVADVWLPKDPKLREPSFPDSPVSKAVWRARERALHALEESRAIAENACALLAKEFPNWRLTPRAEADSPAWGIIKAACSWHADLVVLGSHSRSAPGRFFLGSVAQKTANEAKCAVRIARAHGLTGSGALNTVIAVDGSPDSLAAVQAVASRQWPTDSQCWAIAVADPRVETAVAWPSAQVERWTRSTDAGDEWLGRMLAEIEATLQKCGLKVRTDIFDGVAKEVVLREAESWNANAIFIGAHGLHHGEMVSPGTTASAIAARAHCSVEICRAK